LCACQSGDTFAELVKDSPAVAVPSAKSLGATYPGLPTFGVSSQMKPVAARGASPTSMAMTKHTTVTMTAPLTVDTAP